MRHKIRATQALAILAVVAGLVGLGITQGNDRLAEDALRATRGRDPEKIKCSGNCNVVNGYVNLCSNASDVNCIYCEHNATTGYYLTEKSAGCSQSTKMQLKKGSSAFDCGRMMKAPCLLPGTAKAVCDTTKGNPVGGLQCDDELYADAVFETQPVGP